MAFNTCEQPAASALAINVPEGGIHGYDQHAVDVGIYWGNVRAVAGSNVDLARHKAAHSLCHEIGSTSWLVNTGSPPLKRSAGELRYIEANGERDRRRLLG